MHNELVNQFGALWDADDSPPDVFDFLNKHADCDAHYKLFVLLHDQQRRWQTARPLTVEDYLARLPELRAVPDAKLQLAIGEFKARQSSDTSATVDEFVSRFLEISDVLEPRLSELDISFGVRQHHEPLAATKTHVAESTDGQRKMGRYRLVRLLGEGGYGQVYLGFDEELQRQVAIKVPRRERFREPEDADAYLAEARTVAMLDHPNIVPVHDVGRSDDGSIYVVCKFIEGCTLRDTISQNLPGPEETARLLATVARALHHAHQKRLIHRDIKPSNILIEEQTGTAYVADFGLAIREEEYLQLIKVAGTAAYMSPEQARGEGHRLDARSDIFSLGVMLYELLTGQKPFRANTSREVLRQVVGTDPRPPREVDGSIPLELERICLKALMKRAADRYATAAELADDLEHWQHRTPAGGTEQLVVPKGLRSFDAGDAGFFLDLLPGPRDRDGLPESIHFWKGRIEQTDPQETFAVGLIYGPSGCGKSSLVKAGLLPRLSRHVTAVYLEATPDDTELRLLRALRRHLPALPHDRDLVESFALLRQHHDQKVLVVLDQFEQWLHGHRADLQTELVSALRQCDGGNLQAIVMVRDDFSMAASRFMRALETPIVEGENFFTVDLFDVEHAEKVLAKFGQAFGKLPSRQSALSEQQRAFLQTTVAGLAHDGKVVPVRLALFAELVKSKPWVPKTLIDVGGTEGIGVNFLEETFSGRNANPEHRLHQQAARQVLKALLPEVGANIKGYMRSDAELLEVSGYQNRPRDFQDLLRILDGQLRLMTPTDPEGSAVDGENDARSRYYQLTHDYVVAALRQWLTLKQRETRRGRAEIRLQERTDLWIGRPEGRQLPSIWEWLSIRLLTRPDRWSGAQRAMMWAATKRHVSHIVLLTSLFAAVALVGYYAWQQSEERTAAQRIDTLASELWRTQFEHLPQLLDELEPHRRLWETDVAAIADDPDSSSERRTRGYLALARHRGDHLDYLHQRMLEADAEQQRVLRHELRTWQDKLTQATWEKVESGTLTDDQLIQAAAVLADYAPDDSRWQQLAPAVTNSLVESDLLLVTPWVEALRPVRHHLLTPLLAVYFQSEATSNKQPFAASLLMSLGHGDEEFLTSATLAELVLEARPRTYRIVEPVVRRRRETLLPIIRSELETTVPLLAGPAYEARIARQANAIETLFRLGEPQPFWNHLGDQVDPRLRTLLIRRLPAVVRDWRRLLGQLEQHDDPVIRQAMVLALADYNLQLAPSSRADLVARLLGILRTDPSGAVHSAAEWLLNSIGAEQLVAKEKQRLVGHECEPCNWETTSLGLTLIHIPEPGVFLVGSPLHEPGRDGREHQYEVSIDYSFAISTTEVTVQQFLQFQPGFSYAPEVSPDGRCPINGVSLYDAMRFCRWLSEQEPDFDPHDCCYPSTDQIGGEMRLPADYHLRKGYRLPTTAEWEYAARAGSRTSRFFGNSESHLDAFGWLGRNANERAWPVGHRRPNALGLFDVYGNVSEWVHQLQPMFQRREQETRGGDYRATPRYLRSAMPTDYNADRKLSTIGFRVVKMGTSQNSRSSK